METIAGYQGCIKLTVAWNGFVGLSPYFNRLAQASQDLHSVQNYFLDFSWLLNWPTWASQDLHGG